MVKKKETALKTRSHTTDRIGLYNLLANRLLETEREYKEETKTAEVHPILPFPRVFSKVCVNYSIEKARAWDCLFLLRDFRALEIINGHGIRLKDRIEVLGDLNGE